MSAAGAHKPNPSRPTIDFTIDCGALLKAVGHAQVAANDHKTIPILGNVLIEARANRLKIIATDLDREVSVEVDAHTPIPGVTTISARMLHDLVRGFPLGGELRAEIDEADDRRAKITCGRSVCRLATLDADMFARMSVIADGPKTAVFDIDTNDLERMLAKVAFAADPGERAFIAGVYMHTVETGDIPKLRMVATDTVTLGMADVPAPAWAAMPTGFTLPNKTVQALQRLMTAAGEMTTIKVGENLVCFDMGAVQLISKRIAYPYAEYWRAAPTRVGFSITLDRQPLMGVLQRAMLFATTKNRRCRLDLVAGTMSVRAATMLNGEANDEIEVDYDGEDFGLALNAKRLFDILSHIETDQVSIALTDSKSIVAITPFGATGEIFYLMPIPDGGLLEAD